MLSFNIFHVLICASLVLPSFTSAVAFFPHSEAEGKYSQSCLDAISTNVTKCSNAVSSLDPNTNYTEKALQKVCTDQCRSALQSWEADVKFTCKDVTFTNSYGNDVPVSSLASSIYFKFNQTCLINDGEFCNIFLGNLTTASVNGSAGNDDCNKCSLFKLRDTAQFQYENGPLVYSKGIYQSYTSSCHFTGYPLTAKPTRAPMSSTATASSIKGAGSSSATAASACEGDIYKIKSGDTCHSISLSQGVATWQLLMDNNLSSHCRKFPKNGSLCIKNKCEVYTVKTGDTCSSVANAHNISTVQLRSYNPWINVGCYNFNRTIDTQICINEPGQKYIAPATPSSPSSSAGGAASAVPVPSNIAPNTTTRCGEFYKVQPDEECDIFTVKFGISREDFGVLNPEINVNCTNLWANTSYCVQPVGNINSYPGAPGYVGPSSSVSKVAYTSLPDATYSPIFEFIPLAPNTREGCTMYVPGSDLQYNSTASSSCDIAGHYYSVSVKKLALWNPSLHLGSGSSNSTNTCSFSKSYRYCFRYPEASSTNVPGVGASTPLPSATKH